MKELTFTNRLFLFIKTYWKSLFLIGFPLAISPMLIFCGQRPSIRSFYVIVTMLAYWVARAMPLQATSLIPVALFPLLGILDGDKTARCYLHPINFVFVGSIIIAMTFEDSNLHKRIALWLMRAVNCHPRKLHLAVILMSMFISMWITNAGATVIVCPIIDAIVEELDINEVCSYCEKEQSDLDRPLEYASLEDEECEELSHTFQKRYRGERWVNLIRMRRKLGAKANKTGGPMSNAAMSFFLGGLYATSIGGTGTTWGTTSNLVFINMYAREFPKAPPLDEVTWMCMNIPLMIITTLATWFWLEYYFMGLLRWSSPEAIEVSLGTHSATILTKNLYLKSKALGRLSWHELVVVSIFLVGFILILFRKPSFMDGWTQYITDVTVSDPTIIIFTMVLLFIIPLQFGGKIVNGVMQRPTSIITWDTVLEKFPWGLLFVVGSGYAFAAGSNATGMDVKLSYFITDISKRSSTVVVFISACTLSTIVTQFITNSTVNSVMLPIYAKVSKDIRCHPLYLLMPTANCAAFSFCMELSTPGNAVMMAYCDIPGWTMFKAGMGAAILCLIIELISFYIWARFLIDLDDTPNWL